MKEKKLNLEELFQKYDDEFLKHEKIENMTSKRPDIHAFLLLDKLVPGDCDMVSHAEHDEIWLSVTPDEIENIATEEQILELIRCGVRYDGECFALFV